MNRKDKMIYDNEKGFALLAAIIAALILLAVGVLAIDLSSADRRASAVVVGDKKAFAAAESGVHRLVQDFDPTATWTEANNYTQNCTSPIPGYIWRMIASGIDGNTRFAVCRPVASNLPPLIPFGYNIASGTTYGILRYDVTVVGQSTSYKSMNKVDVGIGFGPVPISP